MNEMKKNRLVGRILEGPGISGRMSRGRKTYLLRLISILTLATIILTPERGLGVGAARQVEQPAAPAAPTLGTTTRVSVASDGSQGNGSSGGGSISENWRYVVINSSASNLVSGDTNNFCDTNGDDVFDDNCPDVFVYDRQTDSTERISVASDGSQGNGESSWSSISAEGSYVAFESDANNLVSGDTNSVPDIFIHDRQTGNTQRVSVASDGSQGNGWSELPSISADGRYVAFESWASDLVIGDTNGWPDVFVHDRQTGNTQRVSVASDGSQGNGWSELPSISTDGRYVAFESWASDLVIGDGNDEGDIFVHDRQTGITELVSVASDGSQGNNDSQNASISANGRYVAFRSGAYNLVEGKTTGTQDIFVHDRLTGITERVSVANDGSEGNDSTFNSYISADGRYVAFHSFATNLVSGDNNNFCDTDWDGVFDDNCPDGFLHDRQTGSTEIIAKGNDGSQGNGWSGGGPISADGRYILFTSAASNLVRGDTNDYTDAFIRDREGRIFVFYLPVTQNQQ